MTDAFSLYFGMLRDPRQTAKIAYSLFDVIFLTVSAVISGAKGWEDIEDFGEAHLDWLQEKGLFSSGIPVHDTIARIISRLDPVEFQRCFIRWVDAVNERTKGDFFAIDGKTLRRSYDRNNRQSVLHMVSAFSSSHGMIMGQLSTEDKSNEIIAIPKLLKLLDIKGCLVSIDAMGCQTKIAKTIVQQEGDYLLAVKGNQPKLLQAVKQILSPLVKADGVSSNVGIEQGHGRTEIREYHTLAAGQLTEQFPEWTALKSIGVAIGYRIEKSGKESLEYRYYISSVEAEREQFAKAVRGHWGIENRLHWVLDVSMREDECQIHRGESAEILACMRHLALNMLRAETTKKASIRRKQNIASMDVSYLEKVMEAGFKVMAKK